MAFNSMIDYTLVRSKRKTIALYLRDDTSIEVRAPFGAPKREIDAFVESKAGWISKNTALCQELNASRVDYVLGYGSLVTYRGKDYPLESKPGNRCGFDDERFFVPPNLTSGQIRSAATLVYRMLAKRDLSVKTQEYARLMGVTPAAVKVSNASRRWGSCSRKKSLNFAWR
ncbi:MAG: M48 family metallopeptidase, partial [Clostridiales Family XIII bacterium]|nr:M48 family metallopeptidase [Clostridiales Family XIII bacterium]